MICLPLSQPLFYHYPMPWKKVQWEKETKKNQKRWTEKIPYSQAASKSAV